MLQPLWTTRLDSAQTQSPVNVGFSREAAELIPLWQAPGLYYLDPGNGNLVGQYSYPEGGAFSRELHGSARSRNGVFDLYHPDGRMAISIQSDGRLLFRGKRPFIAGRFLDRIDAYSRDGRLLWQRGFSDVITALEASELYTVVGSSDGQVLLIDNDGMTGILRNPDGNPVAAAAIDADLIFLVIGGTNPVLEIRNLSSPEQLSDAMSLPGGRALTGPVEMELSAESLYIHDYSLLVGRHGEVRQLPDGAVFQELYGHPVHLMLWRDLAEYSPGDSDPGKMFELRNNRGGVYMRSSAPAVAGATAHNGNILLWNNENAVLYGFRTEPVEQSNRNMTGSGK
ncbi:hypothetical protein [Spirochaeta dissipatitropha]